MCIGTWQLRKAYRVRRAEITGGAVKARAGLGSNRDKCPCPKLTYLELVCCAAYCNERFHNAHQRCIANTWRIIRKAVWQHDVKGQSENRALPDSLTGYAWSSRAVIERRSAELR